MILGFVFRILQTEPQFLGDISEAVSKNLTVGQVVIISICTYLLGALVQYFVSVFLKKVDVKNDRKMKIAELQISKEISTYKSLVLLRGYQKGESSRLLSDIETLNVTLNNDKLLYSRKFHRASEDVIEYFSLVCGDFTKKDIHKETKLFDALYNTFQG